MQSYLFRWFWRGALALALAGGGSALPVVSAQAQVVGQEVPVEPGGARDEVTFSTDNGPQYIVVHDFRVTEVQPTGKDDEYALTLLALTTRGEPDQRVMGGILFEIDGKSTLVPFQQGGVGDVIVQAPPGASELTLHAVDSNMTHKVELPNQRRWVWWLALAVLPIAYFVWRRRQRQLPR